MHGQETQRNMKILRLEGKREAEEGGGPRNKCKTALDFSTFDFAPGRKSDAQRVDKGVQKPQRDHDNTVNEYHGLACVPCRC